MYVLYSVEYIILPKNCNSYYFNISKFVIAEGTNTEAAWCQDIDCGTSVAKKMCPTTCQVGGKNF